MIIPTKYDYSIIFKTQVLRYESGNEHRVNLLENPIVQLKGVSSKFRFSELNNGENNLSPIWPTIIYGTFPIGLTSLTFDPFKFSFFPSANKILLLSYKDVQVVDFSIDSPGTITIDAVTIPGCYAACILANCLPYDGTEITKLGSQNFINQGYTIKTAIKLSVASKTLPALSSVEVFEFPYFYFDSLTHFNNTEIHENLGNQLLIFNDSQPRSQFKFTANTIDNDGDFNLLIGFFVKMKGRFGNFYLRTYRELKTVVVDNHFASLPIGLKVILIDGIYHELISDEAGYFVEELTLSESMKLELVLFCRFDQDELTIGTTGKTRSLSLTVMSL